MPYSLTEANLNAIWLAENQATGKIKLQPDFDEETQKEVLTCYLLPQQNFHTPSMENLLQGSINTADNINVPSPVAIQRNQNGESVRFAPESDDEERPSHFVRVNTPHPKDLIKKKEAIKQRAANHKEKETILKNSTETHHSVIEKRSDSTKSSPQNQLPVISPEMTRDPSQTIKTTENSNSNESNNSQRTIRQSVSTPNDNDEIIPTKKLEFNTKSEVISNLEVQITEKEEKIRSANNSYVNKHVDFKLSEKAVVINSNSVEEQEPDEPEQVSSFISFY